LHNGDEVEIIASKAQSPSPAWETIAVTGKARSAIRRATRDASRQQYAGLGRQIITRAFERAGKTYSDERLMAVLPRLAQHNVDDALAAIGRGELPSKDVLKALFPDYKEERLHRAESARREDGWFGIKRAMGLKFRAPNGSADGKTGPIPIRGIKGDLPVKFADKGGAVPGDRIVGILTPGEGITIYPIHSPELKTFDDYPERWLDVRWDIDEENPERFPSQILVRAMNEPGTLAQIAQVIGENGANIDNIRMMSRSPDFHEMSIELEVWDLKHLNTIISLLKAIKVVNSVTRLNG
jgi:(p)ppGpp synthase/HD superfamily hydrolase